jgi:hypothetical protein
VRQDSFDFDACDNSLKDHAEREIGIFTEALGTPVQERAAFLERVCAGDTDLRHKIEKLLEAHYRIGNFLEEPRSEAC